MTDNARILLAASRQRRARIAMKRLSAAERTAILREFGACVCSTVSRVAAGKSTGATAGAVLGAFFGALLGDALVKEMKDGK